MLYITLQPHTFLNCLILVGALQIPLIIIEKTFPQLGPPPIWILLNGWAPDNAPFSQRGQTDVRN